LERTTVDYKGPLPLPAWLKIDSKVTESNRMKDKSVAESAIVDPESGKLLVKNQCTWTSAPLPSAPQPSTSLDIPPELLHLISANPNPQLEFDGPPPMVVSNLVPPTPTTRFAHPAKIAFIWNTLYGIGQLERSFEVQTRETADNWYEFASEGGALSPAGKGPVHPGTLFAITEWVTLIAIIETISILTYQLALILA
jgi:hypothetical protein